MKMNEEVKVKLHSYLISSLDGNDSCTGEAKELKNWLLENYRTIVCTMRKILYVIIYSVIFNCLSSNPPRNIVQSFWALEPKFRKLSVKIEY
jgi:hypothetical protein